MSENKNTNLEKCYFVEGNAVHRQWIIYQQNKTKYKSLGNVNFMRQYALIEKNLKLKLKGMDFSF